MPDPIYAHNVGQQVSTTLRSTIKGRVITPEDPEYEAGRSVFYGGIDRRPEVIARPIDDDDVAAIINLARETGIELAIRSGGHSLSGHSVSEGGIVLDLKDMKGLEIDVESHTAWAESGLTAADYTEKVGEFGLATGFGDTGSVGIGGITLGGGVGFLARKYGLTIDSLLAADIVTADGQLRRIDNQSYPDLFWAIRGGGGNFGVVTRFQFRLHEVPQVLGGMLILPATADTIAAFMAEAEAAPLELSTIANIMVAPPMPFLPKEAAGSLILMAMMVYAGPIEAGQKVVAPFRAIANPIADLMRPMAYSEMFPPEQPGYRPKAVSTTMFIDHMDQSTALTILKHLQASDAVLRATQLRVLGGAVANVPADATAYAHRQVPILANLAAFYEGPEDMPQKSAWVQAFAQELYQGNPGAYVNFLGDEGEARIRDAYPGPTWERLREIKARYDPNNVFHLNQNISPGISRRGT